MIRRLRNIFVGLMLLLVVLSVLMIGVVDDAPLSELPEVQSTFQRLRQVQMHSSTGRDTLQAGWSAVNITPEHPIDMAGYGPRGPYTGVRDSLMARVLVINNGTHQFAIVSVDLIMFPRQVKKQLYAALKLYGFSEADLYFGATHTHSGIGNWEPSLGGSVIFGKYDEKVVDVLVNKIVKAIQHATAAMKPVTLGFQKIETNNLVLNRLNKSGAVDPYLRAIWLSNPKGQKAVMVSFAGHAVNLDADIWQLSRDYPGVLVDDLEQSPGVDFAMFCAGAVASMSVKSDVPKGPARIEDIGHRLSKLIIDDEKNINYASRAKLGSANVKIEMPPSQMRLTKSLRLRNWVFRRVFGPLEAEVKFMEIGDILLAGMPCDYSGELLTNNHLDSLAAARGHQLFITSFNGNYVGYITDDSHYADGNHDEVLSMNWVGPNKGKYFTDIIKEGLTSISGR